MLGWVLEAAGGAPLTAEGGPAQAPPSAVADIAEAVAGAERPMLVAGRQPDIPTAAAVAELAAAAQLPLLAEPTSQLRHGPARGQQLISAYDLILRRPPERLRSDLVLRFGDAPTSKPLRTWLGAAAGPEQIVIDPPGDWNEPTRRAGNLLRGDPRDVAVRLAGELAGAGETNRAWLASWRDAERLAQDAVTKALEGPTERLSEPGVHRALDAALGDGEQLLLASSMPVRDAEAFLTGSERRVRCFSNRGANGIDGLVSTAVGLAIGADAPTWAVLGDLALAHDIGGLANVADAPPMRFVVIDNRGGRIFEFLPQAEQLDRERFERLFITPAPLDLEAAAALFGLDYRRVRGAGELVLGPSAGHTLLHVVVEPAANVDLRRRIAAAVGESLA